MMPLIAYLAILVIKALMAWRYASTYPRPGHHSATGVTICQPILSGDPDLESALASSLVELPEARFIWLLDESDAAATDIAARLIHRHPAGHIDVMVLAECPEGINPKLFKLQTALPRVTTPVLLVLDDDTRLGRRSLDALLDALERCELSTGLPFYRDSDNLHGRLLSQFVNNNSALTYLPLLPFAPPVSINGMCYALKMSTLDSLGGFSPMLRHLTDDLAVADRVRASGGRIIQTAYPQEVATTVDSFGRYVSQMHRWYVFALLLLRRQNARTHAAIVLLYGLPPVLLAAGLAQVLIHPSAGSLSILAAVCIGRAMILMLLQRGLSGRACHRPLLSLVSELLQPLHLLHALLVKSIRWRTRHYRVYDNDRFVSL